MPVPVVDINKYALEVQGPDGVLHRFTLDELKSKFAHHTIPATIQCAGEN